METKKEVDEEVCAYCEAHIIECENMTSTFICEGRFCEQALEEFNESQEE